MNYSNPSNLAVLACPGAEVFSDEVIAHLKKGYKRTFDSMIKRLSKLYNMESNAVIRQVNLFNDINFPQSSVKGSADKYRPLKIKVSAKFTHFANGEIKTEILESIRGKDLYIIQDVGNNYPVNYNNGESKKVLSVNDHLLTIFVTVDAAKQAGAQRITLVTPVYPYSRQHKAKGREGLTAGRVGKILESLGVNQIITLDLHSRDIINAFDKMKLENLHASYQMVRAFSRLPGIHNDDIVVVAPDTGAVDRNRFYANAFKKPLAMLYKERDYSRITKNAEESNIADLKLLGDIKNKTVFLSDDMVDVGGTLLSEMRFLKEHGAGKLICCISLPFFNGDAIRHFDAAYKEKLFFRIIGTNAVYQEELLKREWYISVNITNLFAQTISRLHQGLSVSSLLDNREIITRHFLEAKEQGNLASQLPFE